MLVGKTRKITKMTDASNCDLIFMLFEVRSQSVSGIQYGRHCILLFRLLPLTFTELTPYSLGFPSVFLSIPLQTLLQTLFPV